MSSAFAGLARSRSFARGRTEGGISGGGIGKRLALLQNDTPAALRAFPQAVGASSGANRQAALENIFRSCPAIPRHTRPARPPEFFMPWSSGVLSPLPG